MILVYTITNMYLLDIIIEIIGCTYIYLPDVTSAFGLRLKIYGIIK